MKPFAAMRLRRASSLIPGWTPAALFDGLTGGLWYDPSDSSTVFQDSAGTIPAVAGDPVGLILDKSGNGINAYQPTSGNRPTLQTSGGKWWVEANGTSAWMYMGSTSGATDFSTLYACARVRSNTMLRTILGKPHAATHVSPYFRWVMFHGTGEILAVRVNSTEYTLPAFSWPLGTDRTLVLDVPGGEFSVGATTGSFTPATLTYPNNVQARLFSNVAGSELLAGRMYGLVMPSRTLTTSEKLNLKAWMDLRS